MNETTKVRKQNMKIYSIYRAISLDIVFYYAIEFLFLTQVKQISGADFVFSQAFYAIFMILLQIPASIIVDKIGTRKCTILGNVFNSIFILLIMCCKDLKMLIFAQFISALCFSIKDIADPALLEYSIPQTLKRAEIFSKLEGKGSKDYFLLNAITYVCSGFLYVINPYIPIIGALCFTILSIFMSLGFEEVEKEKQETQNMEDYVDELWKEIKFIAKSQRLRSLFLYSGIAWGIISLMSTYRSSLLVDIKTPEQIITIVAAILSIASAIGSQKQIQFHNHFRNKSLSTILWIITISILGIGIIAKMNISYEITLGICIMSFFVIDFAKGVSLVLTKRYLGNFTNENILTQIYAVDAISKNIFRAMISFFGSYLLRITDTTNSMIIIGILSLITILGLISYMKTRLGLNPKDYDKNEIFEQGEKKYLTK